MGARLMTSMGDATAVEMTRDEPRADVEDGIAIAVKRGKAPPLDDGGPLLSGDSIERLDAIAAEATASRPAG